MNLNELSIDPLWRKILALLLMLGIFSTAAGQNNLDVHVTNISIAGEISARGLTATFPYPVMATITVTDNEGNPILGLASTSRWVGPQDIATVGMPVASLWKRGVEFHRDNRSFPPNPDIFDQFPAPLFTEFRKSKPFPTSTMLVMDVSGSMIDELPDAKAGNLAFLNELRPGVDRAGLIQFCKFIKDSIAFTDANNYLTLRTKIATTDTCPGTAIYDALQVAVQLTKREKTRRAIILYTDGYDNESRTTEQAAIDSAKTYNIPIHIIALGEGADLTSLINIARQTGGLFIETNDSATFTSIYKRLAAITQNFYMLAYGSPDPARNGTWRRLDLTVCDELSRLGSAHGDYFVPGGPALRLTDLTPALTSFTDLAILENGKPVKAVRPGDRYTYRLRVRNLGPERAESIRLNQLLPPSVNFIDATSLPFYTTQDSLVWQIARLNAGATDSIIVTAEFAANAPPSLQRLISRLTASARNDNTPANNTARDTVRVSTAPLPTFTDVAVTQFVKTDSFAVAGNDTTYFVKNGANINYRVVVTNAGFITARNVRVTDFLPDSARASNFQPAPAGANLDSALWMIANLPPLTAASFTFRASVAPIMPVGINLLINRATVTAANEDPTKLSNNTSVSTVRNIVNPAITDLALAFNSRTNSTIVENGRIVNVVKPGEPIDYRIRVRNLGPETASSIRVRQLLPDSVRFVAASKPLSITTRDSLIWQISQLNSGAVDSITISVLFASKVPPTLTRLISRANLSSPNDTSPANNFASDTIRVVIPPAITDLSLAFKSRTNSTIVESGRIVNVVKPGEPIDYKIRVRNLGPETASSIRVRQLLPDSVRFVAASKSLALTTRDSLIWQIPQLNSGAVDSITISVLFASKMPPTLTRLISRANLSSPNDTSPANNFASDTIRVVIPPAITDLALTFNSRTNSTIVENGRIVNVVKPGEPIDYKIRVRNLGAESASSIRVRQLLPDSVRFVAASKSLALTTRDSLIWQIPQLNSGAVDSITISVLFASKMPPTLTRLISRANLTSPNDASPANNFASDTVRVVIPPAITDLTLTFNSRTNSTIIESGRIVNAVKPGEPIDYKIRVRNLGPESASSIRVRQLLPDSVRFVAASKSLSITTRDSLIWQIPQLNSGGVDSITISLLFAARVPSTLTRLISRVNLSSPNDISPANNSASDTIRVVIPPAITDLALTFNSRTNSTIVENGRIVNAAKPSEPIDYKIRVRNLGPETANSIRVRQLLPDSVRFVAASKTLALTTRDSLIWQIPQLNSGSVDSITISFLFAARVPPSLTRLISRANLTSPNDTSPANNFASDTVRVVIPPAITDLSLTLNSRTNSTIVENGRIVNVVKPGEPIDYKIHVRNLGPETASSIRMRQLLPDSVRFVAASKPLSITTRDSLVWQIPQLNSGAVDSITISVLFASKVPPTLTRLISRANLTSPNDTLPANNFASDTIRVVIPPPITDLALTFNSRTNSTIVENGRIVNVVKPGEPIDYKIRVRNLGPESASSIRVRQLLPDSVRFVAASKSLSITTRDSLIWQIPQLNSGGVDSITISFLFAARVPPTLTRLISRANLSSPNDTSPANNSASDTIRVLIPPAITDLALNFNSRTNSTIVENGRIVNVVKPSEPIDYKIRVRNLGPETASSIRVRQLLPDSVRFVAASKSLALTTRDSLIWQIAQLNSGAVDSITISVLFASKVPPTLTRLISRANLSSPNDTSPANNSASDTIRVVIPPAITDLALTFNSRTSSTIVENGRIVNAAKPGEPIDYKIRVRNLGPETASSIRVRQLLPDSVRFVAASKSLALTTRDSLIWQIPQLNSGAVDSITISFLFASKVPLTLTRLISRANLTSPNDTSPVNNFASDTIRVVIPPAITDLALTFNSRTNSTIVESGRIVNAVKTGEPIDYKIRVRNLGAETASSIRVRQLLPDSVRFVAASKSLALTTRDSLIWQIPQLNSGGVDSITISFLFAARVPPMLTRLISRANLSSPNDMSPANNSASDTIRVVIPPAITDLALNFNSRTNSTIVENGRIVNVVKPGEPIDYKIRVRNLGPETANSIRVRQLLPDSVRFVAASKSLALTTRDSLIWQIPQLNTGGVDSITISVLFASKVPPTLTRLISRANLSSPNDTSPANNFASDTVRVVIPPAITDLTLTFNSRTNSTIIESGRIVNAVKPGEPIDYKIHVRNLGPETASSIRVRQLLPDSVRFVAASKPLSITTRDSLIWQIPQLNSGGVDSITISVLFAARVPPTLTRLISRANLSSPNDTSPANNFASDTIRVVIPPAITDLSLTLNSRTNSTIVENGRIVNAAKPGEPIDYKIRVRNLGPETASSIRVRQLLPDSVRFVAASKSLALTTRDSLIWQIPQLNTGGVDSITISVLFASKVPPTLTRLISRANLTSPNDASPVNNFASDTVRVVIPPAPGSRPLIEANPPEVAVGDSVRVRVQVLAPVATWDLWIYYANGRVDSSYADAYIKTTRLTPNMWFDVTPIFTNTRLFTAAKEEAIRFEIRSRDIFGEFATASDAVVVRSSDDLVLDRNVYEADRQSPLGINFRLSSNREARLDVYDLNGVCIAKLVQAPFNAGWNTYNWNGLTETGRPAGSGVYIIALRSGEFNAWKKCIIVR